MFPQHVAVRRSVCLARFCRPLTPLFLLLVARVPFSRPLAPLCSFSRSASVCCALSASRRGPSRQLAHHKSGLWHALMAVAECVMSVK